MWVEDHLGLHWCKKLILCPDKSLLKGDILIDDQVWEKFSGQKIVFNSETNNWSHIIKKLLGDE